MVSVHPLTLSLSLQGEGCLVGKEQLQRLNQRPNREMTHGALVAAGGALQSANAKLNFYGFDLTVPARPLHFEAFERVHITGGNSALDEVRGELAVVLSLNAEHRCYAVGVYATGQCWLVAEGALTWTGEWDRDEAEQRGTFSAGGAVSISRDGRGEKPPPPPTRLGAP